MIISTFEIEKELSQKGFETIIGVDEAGRGPLAGPVVAGAAVFRHQFDKVFEDEKSLDLIRDSKTLSEKQREKTFDFIQENFWVGVGICDHKTIDKINILEASFLAMKKAIVDLRKNMKNYHSGLDPESSVKINLSTGSPIRSGMTNRKTIILLDGNKKIPNFSEEQRAIIGGDKQVKSISAASIVAKVTRDRMMLEAHDKYPQYCFDKHKGYGTKIHLEALQKYGPCEIHRQSFKPVKDLI